MVIKTLLMQDMTLLIFIALHDALCAHMISLHPQRYCHHDFTDPVPACLPDEWYFPAALKLFSYVRDEILENSSIIAIHRVAASCRESSNAGYPGLYSRRSSSESQKYQLHPDGRIERSSVQPVLARN
jgi:hypothetical protein